MSESQSKGKGRRGRQWFSPPGGGIYSSLILRPAIAPTEALKIPLLTAVVVVKTVRSLSDVKPTIKWPNDILIGAKKLAGILTEISADTDAIDYVVVGLGVNINTPSFPPDIQEIATSLFIESGSHLPRALFLRQYLAWYEHYYRIFTTRGFEPVMQEWKASAPLIGHMISVKMIDRTIEGEVTDIDKDGALILMDAGGESHRIYSGDITYRQGP